MRLKLFLSIAAVALLVLSCFLPWMTIETKALTITGLDTTGTDFGKPGYFHFLWAALFLLFLFINKIWSKRAAIVFAAFNIAWAARNFLLIPICQMGECPQRRIGIYLVLLSSIFMFITPMLSEKLKQENKSA